MGPIIRDTIARHILGNLSFFPENFSDYQIYRDMCYIAFKDAAQSNQSDYSGIEVTL